MYRYKPNSVRSLRVLVGNDVAQEAKYAYYGSALWRIIQYMTQGESTFPSWSDMFEKKKHAEKKETADEIKNRLIRKMRG
jgi:hypothetical protein